MKNKFHTVLACTALVFIGIEIMLIIGSWIISSVFPPLHIRSILSSVGIRWLLGGMVDNICSPLLVYILVLASSIGAMIRSGIGKDVRRIARKKVLSFRSKLGMVLISAEVFVVTLVMMMLTILPHAILHNVEGDLFPSSFSSSLIPVASLMLSLCATTYGIITERFSNIAQWFGFFCYGLSKCSGIIVIYLIFIELFSTIRFIFIL